MAQQTLLELTQNVLSRLDSDSVNSISDTPESLQVAQIIENKYYDILTRSTLPAQDILYQLTGSGDVTLPVQMTLPAGSTSMTWLKYYDVDPTSSQQVGQFGSFSHDLNTDIQSTQTFTTTSTTSNTIQNGTQTFTVASSDLPITTGQGVLAASGTNSMFGNVVSYTTDQLVINVTSTIGSGTFTDWIITNSPGGGVPGYKYVTVIPIDQFLDYVNRFSTSDNNVYSYTFSEGAYDFTFFYRNDKQPSYCTVIENTYVLFDSFNANFDSTLQGAKTLVMGQVITPFQQVDTFVPDMDDSQFPLLLNEATSLAFYELKQMPHAKADQEIKRQWSALQKVKSKSGKPSYFDQLPSYGRVPRTGGYSSGGYGAYKWMRQASP